MEALAPVLLKLAVTPVLIAAASLAGRRWGAEVGGWLVGIPFTSGPISLFLALDRGTSFGAASAAGILAGTASQAAFCLAYAWVAKLRGSAPGAVSGWVPSLAAASVAFLLATAVLKAVVLPLVIAFVLMLGVLALALRLVPRSGAGAAGALKFPAWDLPLRMVVATAFVLTLTSVAPLLGARLAGLVAPYPIYATVLAVFAQRSQGPAAAAEVLRGLLLGLFAFASFFFAVAALLPEHGVAVAFGTAVLAALVVQGSTLAIRRLAAA